MYDEYSIVPLANVPLTKKQAQLYMAYKYPYKEYASVLESYAKPSESKIRIERHIKMKMHEVGGWRYRVISANAQHFSAGYLYQEFSGGYKKIHLVYLTYANTYDFVIYTDDVDQYLAAQKAVKEYERGIRAIERKEARERAAMYNSDETE